MDSFVILKHHFMELYCSFFFFFLFFNLTGSVCTPSEKDRKEEERKLAPLGNGHAKISSPFLPRLGILGAHPHIHTCTPAMFLRPLGPRLTLRGSRSWNPPTLTTMPWALPMSWSSLRVICSSLFAFILELLLLGEFFGNIRGVFRNIRGVLKRFTEVQPLWNSQPHTKQRSQKPRA